MKEGVCLMGEEKEKEVRVADFRSQGACLSEEGHFGWLRGLRGGRANPGGLREDDARPSP